MVLECEMIKDQIAAIQSKLQSSENIPAATKAELTRLLAELEEEVSLLSQTHDEQALRIARSTDTTAQEVTRSENKPEVVEAALDELRASVQDFETSHPKMVGIVGRLATTLSNMGI